MPTPRSRATPALLAHLLVSKYVDHLPLHRQCEIYAREGVTRRTELTRFVTDGRLEADNNIAENAMRIIALGKTQLPLRGQ